MDRDIRKDPLGIMKKYNQQSILEQKPKPFLLSIALTSNPFLKDQENFHYLIFILNEYNKRVSNHQIFDSYQSMVYQFLYRLLSDIARFQTKDDQVKALTELFNWFKEQDIIIGRRKQLGLARYKISKQFKDGIPQIQKQKQKKVDINSLQIVTDIKEAILDPYVRNQRTLHEDQTIPPVKLAQYKRKIINITSFLENKQQTKFPRVLYPKPTKVQELKEVQENLDNPQEKDDIPIQKQHQGQLPLKQDSGVPQQQNLQKKQIDNQNLQQDLGGFGQEAQQPQQQEPQEVQDKLAPKTKIFISPNSPPNNKRKFYLGQFLHFKGQQILPQRSMQERYLKMQQAALKKQKQQEQMSRIAHIWATRKSKITKELQRKLEDMQLKPKYSFMEQQQVPPQRLKLQDEVKYGLTLPIRKSIINPQINLIKDTMKLPAIGRANSLHETNIRKDRLSSLKQKFGKILNISEYQERQTSLSLCQQSSKRRDLSEILRAHSKSKQRLRQLEEIVKLKQKMTSNKMPVNYKSLTDALCLPQDQQLPTSSLFPQKRLLNNPFWVQPKKKKKKK